MYPVVDIAGDFRREPHDLYQGKRQVRGCLRTMRAVFAGIVHRCIIHAHLHYIEAIYPLRRVSCSLPSDTFRATYCQLKNVKPRHVYSQAEVDKYKCAACRKPSYATLPSFFALMVVIDVP